MEQFPLTLHFTRVDIEREYFALTWGARQDLLRRAVPVAASIAAATIIWTVRTPDTDGLALVALTDIPRQVWVAVGLTVLAAGWVMIVPLSTFAISRGGRQMGDLSPSTRKRELGGDGDTNSPSCVRRCPNLTCNRLLEWLHCANLEPVLACIIVMLSADYVWAAVDSSAARCAEVHALVLLAAFAASFVFLASTATAVVPTVTAIVTTHATLIIVGATIGGGG
jgi:hypothetical protein